MEVNNVKECSMCRVNITGMCWDDAYLLWRTIKIMLIKIDSSIMKKTMIAPRVTATADISLNDGGCTTTGVGVEEATETGVSQKTRLLCATRTVSKSARVCRAVTILEKFFVESTTIAVASLWSRSRTTMYLFSNKNSGSHCPFRQPCDESCVRLNVGSSRT